MDDVNFKGTGNMEIHMDRRMAGKRDTRPSILVARAPPRGAAGSGQRAAENLDPAQTVLEMDEIEAMEKLRRHMRETKNNKEFFDADFWSVTFAQHARAGRSCLLLILPDKRLPVRRDQRVLWTPVFTSCSISPLSRSIVSICGGRRFALGTLRWLPRNHARRTRAFYGRVGLAHRRNSLRSQRRSPA